MTRTIGDFGEKTFLREVLGKVARTARAESFDDAVIIDLAEVLSVRDLPYLVYSLDHPSFVRHALEEVPPHRFYGRWVAAVTCNDIVAMGARCKGFSLDLAAPLEMPIEAVQELTAGISDVLAVYGAEYEGGNFDGGKLETVGFAWGLAPRAALVRRQGAQPGHLVCTTHTLGLGWAEYNVRKLGLYASLPQEVASSLRRYKAMPVAAVEPIAAAAEAGCFSSGMDLSDGLVEFLHTIRDRNGCGVRIDTDDLPVPDEVRTCASLLALVDGAPASLAQRPDLFALDPGYDSPLVHAFTAPADRLSDARACFESRGAKLHVVGEVTSNPELVLEHAGRTHAIPPFWDDQCRRGSTLADWFTFVRELTT